MSLTGKTSSLIEPLKKDFIDLLSNIEVNIDYPEYKDIEEVNNIKIEKTVDKSIDYISKLISDGKKANIIKDGINVAIVGKPNVGKSSILNALIGEDKAIVTNIKGTTRDIVEGKFIYKGIVINLFDTAGIRESDDIIESIGINKSIKKMEEADLILMVYDSSNVDKEDEEISSLLKNKKIIKVYNKSDLIDKKDSDFLYISALNGDLKLGIAIIILWIIMSLVRQFLEPKIVSGKIGIHPIFTLIAMYTGFKVIGVMGMIVGPIALIIIKSILTEYRV